MMMQRSGGHLKRKLWFDTTSNEKPKNEKKTEKCWIHEEGSHPVWNCKIFQMLSLKEKLDMVKERKACQACLETTCQGAQDAK